MTDEIEQLSRRYIDEGVFTAPMRDDALHVATAVINRQDVLLSWNSRQLGQSAPTCKRE
jgi:hypothetical protein